MAEVGRRKTIGYHHSATPRGQARRQVKGSTVRTYTGAAALLITTIVTLAACASIFGFGARGVGAGEDWCEEAQSFIGAPVAGSFYNFYCSSVAEIEVTEGRTSPRWQGDQVDASFRFVNANGETVRDVMYTMHSPFASATQCGGDSIRHSTTGRLTFGCYISDVDAGTEHTVIVRAGTASATVTISIPTPFLTQREHEDAELARRPKVEVMSVSVRGDGYNDIVTIRLRNNTRKMITDVDGRLYPRDRWGSAYTRCGYYGAGWTWWRVNGRGGGNTFNLQIDEACLRGLGSDTSFTLTRVMFTDGTRWSP